MAKRTKAKSQPTGDPIAVVCSDTHLQTRAWADRPTLQGDAYWAFEQIVNLAIGYEVPLLVAGDLIDKKINDSGPIQFLCQQLDRLQEMGVPFWYIQGDHDKLDKPWPSLHLWAHHADQQLVPLGRHEMYGLDFRPGGQLQEALEGVPPTAEILLCHQRWSDVHGGLILCDGSLAQVPHARLVLSGDHHKHYEASYLGADGHPLRLVSPGATCMQSIAEPFEHAAWLLYDNLEVSDLPLVSRPAMRTPVVSTPAELEICLAALFPWLEASGQQLAEHPWDVPEHIRKPIVDFHYSVLLETALADFTAALAKRYPAGVHLFTKVYYPVQEDQVIEAEQREQIITRGLSGCLELLVPDQESPLFQGVARLLAAGQRGEAKQELAAQRKEYGLE